MTYIYNHFKSHTEVPKIDNGWDTAFSHSMWVCISSSLFIQLKYVVISNCKTWYLMSILCVRSLHEISRSSGWQDMLAWTGYMSSLALWQQVWRSSIFLGRSSWDLLSTECHWPVKRFFCSAGIVSVGNFVLCGQPPWCLDQSNECFFRHSTMDHMSIYMMLIRVGALACSNWIAFLPLMGGTFTVDACQPCIISNGPCMAIKNCEGSWWEWRMMRCIVANSAYDWIDGWIVLWLSGHDSSGHDSSVISTVSLVM